MLTRPTKALTLQDHYDLMPWAAIPFGDYLTRRRLKASFMGPALPCLVILNPEGQLVRADACKKVLEDPQGQQFPWAEQPSKTSVRSDNLLLWPFLMASWGSCNPKKVFCPWSTVSQALSFLDFSRTVSSFSGYVPEQQTRKLQCA